MSQESSTRILTITQLPDEIIDNIFALYQMDHHPDHDARSPRGTMDPNGFPWNVARVSRTWRNVALSGPPLWSTIDLSIDECYDAQGKLSVQVEPVIQLMLERSTPAPLTINFQDYSRVDSSLAKDIMALLVQHSERWAYVRLWISFELFDGLAGVRNRLPILSKLVLEPYGAQTFHVFDAFQVAPRLEAVSLREVHNTEPYRFPTQQLKVLHGPVYGGYRLAEQCPLLEDCEIEFTASTVHANVRDPSLPPIVRPRLHRLATNSVLSTLGLRVPALTALVVLDIYISNSVYDIIGFIGWNQCSLQRLTISCSFREDLDTEDQNPIRRLFELVPQLTYLGINEDSHYTPWDLLANYLMAPDDSTEPLVPHLNEIFFSSFRDVGKDTMKKIEEMIFSRCMYSKGRFRAELADSFGDKLVT